MKLTLIGAIGKNNELGKNNDLIWHIPSDLKIFKEMTVGKTILMGRKTFESLPNILPNRKHIVLTSSKNFRNSGVETFNSIDSFLEKYKNIDEEIFVIGGSTIYKEFIDLSDTMYLTEIDKEDKEADVYFPYFNKNEWDREVIKENSDNGIAHKHVKYLRK